MLYTHNVITPKAFDIPECGAVELWSVYREIEPTEEKKENRVREVVH